MAYYHLFWDTQTNTPKIIKSGFNIWSVIFFPFYFVYLRAWYCFGIYLAGYVFLTLLVNFLQIPSNIVFIISLIYNLFIGFDAAEFLFKEYHKKGFKYLKSDFYQSLLEAEQAAFNFR